VPFPHVSSQFSTCVAVKPLKVLSEKVPADFKLM
jgi:hypothetical protein